MLNESAPSRSMSNPASRRTLALPSSLLLHQMNSSTSGWSALRMTILAARRVLPPLLMVPAEASAPRMKLTGPLAVPPPWRSSALERILDRLIPEPEPPLKIVPSSRYQFRMRVHRVVDSENETGTGLLRYTYDADVEPHRTIEGRPLCGEDELQFCYGSSLPRPRRQSSHLRHPTW